MSIGIGSETAIVIELAFGGSRRGSIEAVATVLADQHPLQQAGHDGTSGGKALIVLQMLLCKCEGPFRDQGRHRDFDPLLARPFVMGTAARAMATPLAQ